MDALEANNIYIYGLIDQPKPEKFLKGKRDPRVWSNKLINGLTFRSDSISRL